MQLSGNSVVVRRDETLFDTVDEAVVAMNLDNGAFYGLNAVGSDIWRLLQQPRRIDDIRDRLLDIYDVDPALCERQVISLLEKMLEERLIDTVDSGQLIGAASD